ncbi:MAG: DNA helicase RecQ [Cellvibrionaceae bacterium]
MHSSLDILKTTFGYDAFRGQQAAIIESVIEGDDALVIMPTGGGKSLCYQIPSIVRPGCGVVISPLIALMQDQVDALKELGIKSHYLNSTQSAEEARNIEQALIDGECDLLYIAPERLIQARTLSLLQRANIALFAIDEAHCVSQWGHDFRSDYLQLRLLAEQFPDVPRIALTATADSRTQEEISERLSLAQAEKFLAGFDRPNICYRIALKNQPKQQLLRFLKNEHANDSGIVYCLSRKKTETTAEWLSAQGFTALPYHAGLSHELRERHQKRFLREDNIIIVATIAFGMGIDKPDVRFVAHLDLPKSIEAYYQETGRAGRDGEPANAWMVYGLEDVIKLREMMAQGEVTQSNAEYKRIEQQKLEAMLGLCEITSCRRHALLHYFGDDSVEQCGNCDMCIKPAEVWDGTEAARKAISCAYRTEQRFGVSHLVDVLRGAETEKIQQFNHHHLSVYGIGKDLDKQQWRSVYRQLIARGLLHIDFNHYNAVRLAETCRSLLQGKTTIALRKDSIDKSVAGKSNLRQKKSQAQQQYGAIWDALKSCRATLAKSQGVPPYVIFHDSTLMEMAEVRPETSEQFAKLSGVGAKKQEKYAADFLAVIQQYDKDIVDAVLSDTVMASFALFQQDKMADVIAEERSLSVSTVYSHASQLIKEGKLSLGDVIELSEKELSLIEGCLAEHNLTEEGGRLKPVYDELAEVYSYDILRCVYMNFLRKLSIS